MSFHYTVEFLEIQQHVQICIVFICTVELPSRLRLGRGFTCLNVSSSDMWDTSLVFRIVCAL
jgi:hypothetical protein